MKLLIALALALAPLRASGDLNGWKQINVFVGNETADPKSVFHATDANQLGRAKQWHSQVGQDKTVALLTKGAPGYFVDLAANDAKSLSNTLTLERDFGWRGVCIEPNPRYWHGLLRRQCVHVAAAVGRTENEVMSFNFGRGALGGLIGAHFDNRPNRPNLRGEGLTKVHTVPLLQIFQHVRVPQVIDYMSFDVEGAESYIGTVFPWETYTVKLLTVERPKPDLQEVLKTRADMVLLKNHGGFGDQMWCHKSVEAEYRAVLQSKNLLGNNKALP